MKTLREYISQVKELHSLNEYIREQLDDSCNVLITEGKFWDWIKSLFKSKNKKYKDSYDEWIRSVDGAKEYAEKINKLKKEYSKKKEEIIKNINDKSSPDDIKKACDKISELDKKKFDVTQKINNENEKLLKDRPEDAIIATCIEAIMNEIKILQEWKELYIDFIKSNKKLIEDVDELKKRNEDNKKSTLEYVTDEVNRFNMWLFKDANEKERKAIIDTLKDGKVEKYFALSGDEISLNKNEYSKLLDAAYKKILEEEKNEKS